MVTYCIICDKECEMIGKGSRKHNDRCCTCYYKYESGVVSFGCSMCYNRIKDNKEDKKNV